MLSRFKIAVALLLTLLFLGCPRIGENKDSEVLKIQILQELFFLEKDFSRKRCDNFINDPEVMDRLRALVPEAGDSIFLECYKIRNSLSDSYDR